MNINETHSGYYAGIIDEIEMIRSRNNVNWMDVLRLAFKHAPEEARLIMSRINSQDTEIADLLTRLASLPPTTDK